MDIKVILGTIFTSAIIFAILYTAKDSEKPFKRSIISVLSGVSALVAVNIAGIFTGVYIPISTLSLCISTVGGIPAVTVMLLIDTFFR